MGTTSLGPRVRAAAGWVLVALPVVLVLVLGWQRRWLNEDAYINLRVIDNLFAGHGPVFNAGERIEVGTSPAWIGALSVSRATLGHFVRMEWVAVLTALAASVAGFAVAARATRQRHPDAVAVVPVGLLAVAAVPVVWDFSTSGLEMGAVWLWIAGCWSVLVRISRSDVPLAGWRRRGALAVLGFGTLVRPDLAAMSVCLLAGWLAIVRPGRRAAVRDLAVAVAAPVVYEVFRMGYYANVVPNTALAKDASGLHVAQGLRYLDDLVSTYWLWIPLAVFAVFVARDLFGPDRRNAVATGAIVAAGLVHAAYMILAGGDYMHGRLLLPALFAVALPAAVPVQRSERLGLGLAAVGLGWAVVCAFGLRYPPPANFEFLSEISDWRSLMRPEDRISSGEVPWGNALTGGQLRELAERGESGYVTLVGSQLQPADTGGRVVVVMPSIGVPAYRAGIDVWVIDFGGLGEPLTARTEIYPDRPAGHRKQIDLAWQEARWGVEDPTDPERVAAAEAALTCGPISDLLDAVSEPMSPGRFLSNFWNAPRFTFLDVPNDPRDAPTC